MDNNLKLTDNGEVHFFEDISNGTNKLITKGPVALSSNATWTFSSVDLDFSSLTHTASGTEFLTIDDSGAISRSVGSATLDGAYDAGDTITVDDGAVTLNGDADNTVLDITQTTAATTNVLAVQNSGTGDAIQIDQDGEGVAADINATHTGSNNVVDVTNAGTGDAVQITQAGAGVGLQLNQNGEAVALDINATHTGSNNVVDIQNSGTGDALMLTQDGEGIAFHIDQNATGAIRAVLISNDAAGDGLEINQNGDGLALDINKTNTDTAKCVAIDNDSSGQGLHITQNGAGAGIQIDQAGAATALDVNQDADAVGVSVTGTTGTSDLVNINKSAGNGSALHVEQAAAAVAIEVTATNASSSAQVMDITNDTQGRSLYIKDSHASKSGSSLQIDRTSTAGNLITATGDGGTFTVETTGLVEIPGLKVEGARTLAIDANGEIDVGASNSFNSYVRLQPASGTTDNLDSIDSGLGLADGLIVILKVEEDADTITVRHGQSPAGTGEQILLSGGADATLDDPSDRLMLQYDGDKVAWVQLSFSSNS